MKHYLLNYSKKRQYVLVFGDILILFFAIVISYAIRIYFNQPFFSLNALVSKLRPWLVLIILPHLFTLYLLDQYNLSRLIYRLRATVMIVLSIMLAGLIISTIFFFFPKYIFGRQILLIHLGAVSLLMVLWRLLFNEIASRNQTIKRIALLGSEDSIFRFLEELAHIPYSQALVKEIYITHQSSRNILNKLPDFITQYSDIKSLLNGGRFDILLFEAANEAFTDEEIRQILQMKHIGKGVFELATFYKNLTGKIPLNFVDGHWILNREGLQGQISKPYVHIKRFIDIVFASVMLLLCAPLLVIIAALIKLESKGKIFFPQERLGLRRRPFKCYKFRTMIENAEKECGPVWACKNDSRITKLGTIFRITRLDELPQLWNIVKGDISFVGPRPIREHFANKMSRKIPFYEMRFSVQPGLSGWAQIHGCYAVPYGLDALQYELFYIENMSLFIDVMIVIRTVKMLLKGMGK